MYYLLTPFSLDGRRQTVLAFSDLFFATRIFVVFRPLLRPTANSWLPLAILYKNQYFYRLFANDYRYILTNINI